MVGDSFVDGSRVVNPFSALGKEFLIELKTIVQAILVSKGLKGADDLVQSVEFSTDNSRDSLYMWVNDYYAFASQGRKSRVRKIPIYALIQWIKKRNITSTKYSTNQLAYAIQNSIYKSGIRGKNFIKEVEETVGDSVEEKMTEELAEWIADQLYVSFTKNVPFAV